MQPLIPYQHLGPAKQSRSNQPRNLFHRAQAAQRQNWATQHGRPPIPESRANHPWEEWETTLLLNNLDGPLTVADLATWTGRTPNEIHTTLDAYELPLEDDLD